LRYALSLQTDVVITGMDDMDRLNQGLSVARNFKPLNQKEIAAMLDKTRTAAMAGEFEKYKISNRFDGTVRNPQWLG